MRQGAWLVGLELLSRKGLRYLTPLWFALLLVGSGLAGGAFFLSLFVLQLLAYAAIPAGFLLPEGPVKRLASPAVYFGIGNLAAILGWWKVVTGSELGRWQTAERPFESNAPQAATAEGSRE